MKQRILMGIVMAIIFLIPFYIGGDVFTYFSLILALMVFYEYSTIINIRRFGTKFFVGAIGVILLFSPLLFEKNADFQISSLLALVVFFITATVFNKGFSIEKAGTVLIGVLYFGFGFSSMAEAHIEKGLAWTFVVILTIWATDSGAYFIGKKFGKRKLAKTISPNKTIEGSLGGMMTAIAIALLLQLSLNAYENYLEAISITLLVSIAAQIGDLVESGLKRHYGVKDSGKILPGHGGVMDRMDSWIFVFIGLKLIGIV
ncbi:phosphatidate cytidylyltransferase [Pontibacillus litoralis]|uniref:Phosphatidate cytidylyltransferase n=1 Tax=Pontibacillus litoralis JSM 072002 TaxID=1385512 RepID=A0A0A5GAN2_9BACI|nr:phosphatidate cytidylyltransferase [Pontibacillus litoralis]KGX88175.1 phosphatidate cytidylyltransferase [Pontibacillus litoralis JSM 072002]